MVVLILFLISKWHFISKARGLDVDILERRLVFEYDDVSSSNSVVNRLSISIDEHREGITDRECNRK